MSGLIGSQGQRMGHSRQPETDCTPDCWTKHHQIYINHLMKERNPRVLLLVLVLDGITLPNDTISRPRLSQQHPVCSPAPPPSDIRPRHWPASSILSADVSLTWQISWPAISCPPPIMRSRDPTKPQTLGRGPMVARWGFITCHSSPAVSIINPKFLITSM